MGLAAAHRAYAINAPENTGHIARAISHFEAAFDVYAKDETPNQWVAVHRELIAVYAMLRAPESPDKIILHCAAALEIYDRIGDIRSQTLLLRTSALAYRDRLTGNPVENIEKAIAYLESAAELSGRESSPSEWAAIQCDLGGVLSTRFQEDRADTIDQAIFHYEQALEVYSRVSQPLEWAQESYSKVPR